MRTLILALLFATPAFGQTWFEIGAGDGTVTAPVGTVLRYGAPVSTYSCADGTNKVGDPSPAAWSASVTVQSAGAFVAGDTFFGGDPIYCVVKEIDVLETSSPQTLTYNGTTVTVPALVTEQPFTLVWTGPNVQHCWKQTVTSTGSDGKPFKTYNVTMCDVPATTTAQ